VRKYATARGVGDDGIVGDPSGARITPRVRRSSVVVSASTLPSLRRWSSRVTV
jgi:hypothetical protein